jgi:hypothetical protein
MANAVSRAAVTTPTAGMPALLPVTVRNLARFAMRGATSSAATRDAQRSAASHALLVLKRSVHLAARTPSAICRVPLLAIGFRAPRDARDFCNAAINARLFVAPTARAKCTVRFARRMKSKTSELTLSC